VRGPELSSPARSIAALRVGQAPALHVRYVLLVQDQLSNAWAAGFIDGEGCITIRHARGRYYQVLVTVGQSGPTGKAGLDRLSCLFGGSVRQAPARKLGQYLDAWTWGIVSLQADACLRRIRPFLVVKAAEADIALQFRQYVLNPGSRVTVANRAAQAELFRRMREAKNYHKQEGTDGKEG
jgi:hypothetical protein